MKLNHYRTHSIPAPSIVTDDFGTEHDMLTGDGDFGNLDDAPFDRAAGFLVSGLQTPEAYEQLWGNET
ncbi:hypothetical protein ACU4HD_12150 [Cupriavidus basilensis]